MKVTVLFQEIVEQLTEEQPNFPKYVTQLLNLANQIAQGTRPKVVGQLSDLIQQFPGKSYEDWVNWYIENNPNAIDQATARIAEIISKLKEAINLIDHETIKKWVRDLVLTKTYVGLCFHNDILKKLALYLKKEYRYSTSDEEAQGIDGWIGTTPVSIKPISYKYMNQLPETLKGVILYYKKTKKGIEIEFNPKSIR